MLENQKKVLECLYKARFSANQPYLSTKTIISETKLPGSTVKDVLSRFVKNGWVKKRRLISSSNTEKRNRRQTLVRIKIKDELVSWVPIDILDEFEKKLSRLVRKKSRDFPWNDKDEETYFEILQSMDKRKANRIQNEHNLSFKGRMRLVKSIKNWTKWRRRNFYKILVFPYIIDDRVGGRTKLSTKQLLQNRWKDIPKTHELFWKNSTNEVRRKYNSRD